MPPSINIDTPKAFKPLWSPSRYKVMYGGRGGAKSWNVARTLLAQGIERPLRILCTRELQVSIQDSVHRLLSDQIVSLGLEGHYRVHKTSITGGNGTEFLFAGLHRNTRKIKSFEGIDRVWAEEAAAITKESWDLLLPTIRKDDSEIWVTFNPELETDDTYVRFVLNTPVDCLLIPVSWRDNPYFPEVLDRERLAKKASDPRGYAHVWEGHPLVALEGAIFEDQITDVVSGGRICEVPHDKTKPVVTFWDLGRDTTAIWFVQERDDGGMFNVIDYYEKKGKEFPYFLGIIQGRGYIYSCHYLPHDGTRRSYDTGKSPADRMEELGMTASLTPRTTRKYNSIENARALFPMLYFDEDKTMTGLEALRRYRWKESGDNPVHDIYSHGSDAFLTFADTPFIQWDLHLSPIFGTMSHAGKSMLSDYDPLEMEQDADGNYVYAGR